MKLIDFWYCWCHATIHKAHGFSHHGTCFVDNSIICIYIYITHLLWWWVLIRFGSPSGQEALPALKKPCFPTKAPVPATSFPVTAGKSAVAKNFMLRRLNAAALAGRGYDVTTSWKMGPVFLGGSNSRSKSLVTHFEEFPENKNALFGLVI